MSKARSKPRRTVDTQVIVDVAAIIREARQLIWLLLLLLVATTAPAHTSNILNSKPAVAVAQYMVGEMEKPRP